MAKRKIELFIEIKNDKDFNYIVTKNKDKLICAELYNNFVGSCSVMDKLFQTIKLDWSDDKMILLKIMCDNILCFSRFWGQSEPVYIFIVNKKVTNIFRGVDQIQLADISRIELNYFNQTEKGIEDERPKYNFQEITPGELDWHQKRESIQNKELEAVQRWREERQAARKRHRAERIAPHLQRLNFVLFWPHAKHAHPDLYQRWDDNNIIMVGRELIQLTKEMALDVLYEADVPMNEASMHSLLQAPALAICFRLLDDDKHFVSLVRRILYKDTPSVEENNPLKDISKQKTAFEMYSTISLSEEKIKAIRREEKLKIKEEEKYKRARRLSEMQRLALQAKEEAKELRKIEKEKKKIEALKAGDLSVLENIEESDEEDIDIPILNESIEDEVIKESSSEDEDEYFPPEGLMIPGLYSPPNDIAKANALPILFPKIVAEYVTPPAEYLPEHVLVILNMSKRSKAIKILRKYKDEYIIHMGVFKILKMPDKAVHIAYTVKQFDSIHMLSHEDIYLAIMLNVTSDIPLLALIELVPEHISRDTASGERECATLFPVNYADDYPELEDFDIALN